jgi:hypothetical protein
VVASACAASAAFCAAVTREGVP